MVPARFDMDQPLNCCKTHKDASTRADKLSLSHTHTHTYSVECVGRMLERKSPYRPAPGLDSVLHSDRKHPSDIRVGSLSSVPLSFIL